MKDLAAGERLGPVRFLYFMVGGLSCGLNWVVCHFNFILQYTSNFLLVTLLSVDF